MKALFKPLLILVTAIVIGAILLFSSNVFSKDTKTSKEAQKQEKTITIGLDDTFVPMGFKDENGKIVGFDVDVANKAFSKMGYKVKFQAINWDMKESELNNKTIDAIWNGYTKTPAREKKVAFTDAYFKNTQAIITLKDSDINTIDDLKGKIVATQTASSSLEAMEKTDGLIEGLKDGQPILFDTFNEAFMDLEAGRVDALVADEILARYYIGQKNPENYKILKDNLGNEEYCVGLRKDDTKLLEELNSTLNEMKSNGEFDEIKNKWFK